MLWASCSYSCQRLQPQLCSAAHLAHSAYPAVTGKARDGGDREDRDSKTRRPKASAVANDDAVEPAKALNEKAAGSVKLGNPAGSSLISMSEADFLNSEHERSSAESRAGIVSLSYMMGVWDRESNVSRQSAPDAEFCHANLTRRKPSQGLLSWTCQNPCCGLS